MRHTPTTPTRPTTVLVADDDEDLRTLIAATLRNDGYTVVEVGDGQEALDYLSRAIDEPLLRPDIVLTDVRMPNVSGFGVLEALKKALVVLPIIVMTVVGDESVRAVAKRLGAVGLLHKPFDMDDLRTAILNAEGVLELARSRRV